MAGSTVVLTFAGDSTSLEKSFDRVGSGALDMAKDLDKAEAKSKSFGGAMDSAGNAADASESKFMGAADLLDGLGGAFGLPTEGATGMMRAFGDLSGGFAVLQPMIGAMGTMFTTLGTTLMTPPVGVILLIAALAAALVLAYQKSETFRDIVNGVFEAVQNAVGAAVGFIKKNWDLLLPILLGPVGAALLVWRRFGDDIGRALSSVAGIVAAPFKAAFGAIARLWNDTVGRLSFEVPSWVPGLGGRGFSMPQLPEFHTGGTVGQGMTPGSVVPGLLLAGESVNSLAGGGGGGTTVIQLVLDGRVITEVVHNGLLAKQRRTPLGIVT